MKKIKLFNSVFLTISIIVLSLVFSGSVLAAEVNTNITEAVGVYGFFQSNLGYFVTQIVQTGMILAAILALFYLIWGAIDWITSGGDQGKYEEARKKITTAVIGLAVMASVWVLWLLVLFFFGINRIPQLQIGGLFGGGGNSSSPNSGSSSSPNDCWPFDSCAQWQQAFIGVHGRPPDTQDFSDFLDSQDRARDTNQPVTDDEWIYRYNNGDWPN